jgi:hypothetical protein
MSRFAVFRPSWILVALLLIGCALRIWSALLPGSLWFDELSTGLNVMHRGWGDLLEPLGFWQVAPAGFVAAEMAAVALFGLSDLSLRLFPLVASLASLFLFWRIATRFLTGSTLLGSVAIFAMSPALVWYARKAKQYASDICVTLILLLLAIHFLEGRISRRVAWIMGAIGLLVIPFSQPSVFVAAGLVVVLGLEAWRGRSSIGAVAPIALLWGLGCLVQVWTSVRLAPVETQIFMQNSWENAGAFVPPATSETWRAIIWLPKVLFGFVGFVVALLEPDSTWELAFVSVYSALIALGIVKLLRSRTRPALLLLVPFGAALVAAASRTLPLNGRLMIYVGPTFLIACMVGVESVRAILRDRGTALVVAALVAFPAMFSLILIPVLAENDHAEPVLEEVRKRWEPGDVLYVYWGAEQAMLLYGEPLGLEPWILGPRTPDPQLLFADVDQLRGRPRAWFFYVHSNECGTGMTMSYLDDIGTELDRIPDPHGLRGMHEASAVLYDLSDPGRLSRSSAATQPVLDPGDPRCREDESVGKRVRRSLRSLFGRQAS